MLETTKLKVIWQFLVKLVAKFKIDLAFINKLEFFQLKDICVNFF
ncbi:hypothetical protein [Campylobacter troglodytis]|nr:hypothetical protein [Campylobacter troglodytis]